MNKNIFQEMDGLILKKIQISNFKKSLEKVKEHENVSAVIDVHHLTLGNSKNLLGILIIRYTQPAFVVTRKCVN